MNAMCSLLAKLLRATAVVIAVAALLLGIVSACGSMFERYNGPGKPYTDLLGRQLESASVVQRWASQDHLDHGSDTQLSGAWWWVDRWGFLIGLGIAFGLWNAADWIQRRTASAPGLVHPSNDALSDDDDARFRLYLTPKRPKDDSRAEH